MKKFNISIFICLIICFTFFGKTFAIENKIVLKINNAPVTSIDIFNEVNRLNFFEKKINELDQDKVYQIALQSLTNHMIKRIEVLKNFKELKFNNEEYLNSIIKNQAKELNYNSIEVFKDELKKSNLEFSDFKKRLIVDILWNEIIFTRYSDKVKIDEDLIKNKIIQKGKITKSFLLREIIFDVKDKDSIDKTYDLIKKDIDTIGFNAAALKHSISNSSNNEGEIGWINENSINKNISDILKNLKKEEHTRPIRIQSGFAILQLIDTKELKQELDLDNQLKLIVKNEKQLQLNNYSNLYFNKVKKNIKIDVQ